MTEDSCSSLTLGHVDYRVASKSKIACSGGGLKGPGAIEDLEVFYNSVEVFIVRGDTCSDLHNVSGSCVDVVVVENTYTEIQNRKLVENILPSTTVAIDPPAILYVMVYLVVGVKVPL